MSLMLLVGTALVGIVLYSARSMDNNIIGAQSELINNSISERLVRSLSELRSVAWWDEAVVKSGPSAFNGKWLDLEIGVFMTESFHHDRIMIIDEHDRPVYGFSKDGHTNAALMQQDLAAAGSLIKQVRGGPSVSPRVRDADYTTDAVEDSRYSNRRYGRGAAAVIKLGNHGELASIMAITPSVDMKLMPQRPRLLISFIRLDSEYWKNSGRDLLLPDLGFSLPHDVRGGDFQLKTDDNRMIGSLRWTPRRPGRILIRNVLPIVLVGLALSTLFGSAFSRRLVSATRALAEREATARHIANHDALTGLPNRRMLESEMQRFADLTQRSGMPVAIACIDIDRFKDINDTLGHSAGDQLIRGLAARLRAEITEEDFLARLGGDEFAVLRRCNSDAEAQDLISIIRACMREPFLVNGALIETNASVGLAMCDAGRSFEDVLREADIALYEAKARGRGCDVRFETTMSQKIEKRRMIEVDLRQAIAQRELTVVYQPIVEAHTGQITSVEALVRWNSERHGPIGPDVFIPIAEEAGLMADLGRLVIERAISDARRWPQLQTAINVSAAQLRATSILEDLMEPTRRFGISASQITIEITESVLMANDEHTARILKTLKDEGFALALDDFGTGYSSLSYIRDFPFDKLKIDRSFIHGVANSERALAIIQAVANFGSILGKDIVAEGVETEQEMQAMQRTGCTHLQGYLFSKPVPAEHIEAMIAVGRLGVARSTGKVAQRVITRRLSHGIGKRRRSDGEI